MNHRVYRPSTVAISHLNTMSRVQTGHHKFQNAFAPAAQKPLAKLAFIETTVVAVSASVSIKTVYFISSLITLTHAVPTNFHNFWPDAHCSKVAKRMCTTNPSNAFCVTALPCKILIAILVGFAAGKNVTVLFWQYLCQNCNFSKFHNVCKNCTWRSLLTRFVSADVGNQLKVMPNAMVADDALMPQRATAHCAYKIAATSTREISESIHPDLWPPNRTVYRTPAVTVLLFHLLAPIESEIRIFTLTIY